MAFFEAVNRQLQFFFTEPGGQAGVPIWWGRGMRIVWVTVYTSRNEYSF